MKEPRPAIVFIIAAACCLLALAIIDWLFPGVRR